MRLPAAGRQTDGWTRVKKQQMDAAGAVACSRRALTDMPHSI